jgi:hypothetical protein
MGFLSGQVPWLQYRRVLEHRKVGRIVVSVMQNDRSGVLCNYHQALIPHLNITSKARAAR